MLALLSTLFLLYTVFSGAFLALAALISASIVSSRYPNRSVRIFLLFCAVSYVLVGLFLSYTPLTGTVSSGYNVDGQFQLHIWNGEYTYEGKVRMLKFLAIGFSIYMFGQVLRISGKKSQKVSKDG